VIGAGLLTLAIATVQMAEAGPPTRTQKMDMQGDVMIWGGSSFALNCSDGQTDPETGIVCYSYDHTRDAKTSGLQQGWVWSVNLPRYAKARRQTLYGLIQSYQYTHVTVHVVPCVVGDPGYGDSYAQANTVALCTNGQAGADPPAGSYGKLLNNILDEIHAAGLVTLCAGVAPGVPPAADLSASKCDLAMDDWDGETGAPDAFQKDCRLNTLKQYFPTSLHYIEMPGFCDPQITNPADVRYCSGPNDLGSNDRIRPKVDSCTPSQFSADLDGFLSNPTGDTWFAAAQARDPYFAGVLIEASSAPSDEAAVLRYLQVVQSWWRNVQQVRFEFDIFNKYHSGGDFATYKNYDDYFKTNAPWLKGFMSGGTTHPAPIPHVLTSFDGDTLSERAVFRPATGQWIYQTSASGYATTIQTTWGNGGDIPVPGDYDGDGIMQSIFSPASRR
jgi:hypothetical protein